jgi:hypothetical protein
MWHAAAGDPYPMEKNPDEIPMFTRFAECGLALPASNFFKGLLEYYDIEYRNLNPNGIFHTSVFVHFCEAFLGIKPHWVLFRTASPGAAEAQREAAKAPALVEH